MKLPAWVGVPDKTPVVARLRPGGRLPLIQTVAVGTTAPRSHKGLTEGYPRRRRVYAGQGDVDRGSGLELVGAHVDDAPAGEDAGVAGQVSGGSIGRSVGRVVARVDGP